MTERPTPYYEDDSVTLYHGDCLDMLRSLPDASVDAVVTDPPYGLEFMGKDWDGADGFRRSLNPNDAGRDNAFGRTSRTSPEYRAGSLFQEWCEAWSRECLRVLKPGGHLLAFGGTRTWHRLACAVEDAGFEIRDSIAWMYGSGFPKSLDVSKAIDKRRDWSLVERLAGEIRRARADAGLSLAEIGQATLAATDGTYGKWYHRGGHMFFETGRSLPSRPEWEQLRHVLPIAPEFAEVYDEAEREVLRETTTNRDGGSWAEQVASGMFQTGERTIRDTAPATPDAERWQGWGSAMKPAFEPVVVARKPLIGTIAQNVLTHGTGALNIDGCRVGDDTSRADRYNGKAAHGHSDGYGMHQRTEPWAAPAGRWPANVILDESQAEVLDEQSGESSSREWPERVRDSHNATVLTSDTTTIHNAYKGGGFSDQGGASRFFYVAKADQSERVKVDGIAHPTVKPLDLMRWLVRLVTPPGGTVLEPFAGSGTTVEACLLEGFKCIAIEREADYLPLIQQRIDRRLNPVAAIRSQGEEGGLFDLLNEETA